jgi:hypothetical protein
MSKIQDVVSELRKLYPEFEILIWQKNDKAQLIVNERIVFKFEMDFMEKYLEKFGEEALKETTKIWAEYIHTRYVKRFKRFKKENGRPALGFSESQIKFAMNNTKSNSAAARFLNVSFNTYRKYARIYNLFEAHKNQSGKDIQKGGRRRKVPWDEIFDNKHPNYNLLHLKRRLREELIIEEKCEVCNYSTRRDYDNKISLVLDFRDGNHKNMSRENMRFLCYNCKFNSGKRLGKRVIQELKEVYDSHIEEEKNKKTEQVWKDLNPEPEDTNDIIIQTNKNEIDDIWDKFNK